MRSENESNFIRKAIITKEANYKLSLDDKVNIWNKIENRQKKKRIISPVFLSGIAATIMLLLGFKYWPDTIDQQMDVYKPEIVKEHLIAANKEPQVEITASTEVKPKDIQIQKKVIIIEEPAKRDHNYLQRIASIIPNSLQTNQEINLIEIAKRIQDYTIVVMTAEKDYDMIVYDFSKTTDNKEKDKKKRRIKFRLNIFNSDNRITEESLGKPSGWTLASSN